MSSQSNQPTPNSIPAEPHFASEGYPEWEKKYAPERIVERNKWHEERKRKLGFPVRVERTPVEPRWDVHECNVCGIPACDDPAHNPNIDHAAIAAASLPLMVADASGRLVPESVGACGEATRSPKDSSAAIDLHPLARYGFLGRALERIGPATEVRAGVTAMMLITIIGNLFGHKAWTITEARVDGDGHRQYPTFLTAYIGRSSKGRKGTSWNLGKQMMKSALGHEWNSKDRITSVASGEGIIHQVRDPRSEMKKPSKNAKPVMTVVDEGVRDKRKICVVEEMSLIFNLAARPGNIILDIIRACADCSDLDNPTKNAKEYATDPTVSMITHSTQQALLGNLKADNITNGVLNRFLWVWTSRNKRLPLGHSVEFHDLGNELAKILEFNPGEVFMSEDAKPIWRDMYMWLNPEDSESEIIPIIDSILARAEMYLIRLALMYALLDRSRTIQPRHLQAAWAMWAYSEESARRIFGNSVTDKTADALIEMLKEGDMTSTSVYEAFNKRLLATDLKSAIKRLPPGTITTYELRVEGKAPAIVYHYDASKAISTIRRAIDAPWLKMTFPDVQPEPSPDVVSF